MKQIFKGIKIVAVFILTLAFVSCDEDDAVLPQLEAGFTHTINQDTGTVTFLNTSTNADAYTWDFGDTTASTEINPIKTYPSGTYTVVLTATNVSGAEDTFEDVITISIPEVISFPITFDNALVDYGATVFGGTAFQIVENPAPGGSNDVASNVGEVANSGAAFEGLFFELGVPLDLSTDKTVTMNVWSTVAVDVLVKLEQGTGADVEVSASHGGSGWEQLTFTFNSDSSFSVLTIFIDGPGTDAGTFYIDDIAQVETVVVCMPETAESAAAADLNITFQTDSPTFIEDNAGLAYEDNPDFDNEVNSSCRVGQVTRGGASGFDNVQLDLADKLDFNSVEGLKMKVWSPEANTPVLLKIEEIGNGGNFVQIEQTVTNANEWTELTFDFDATATPQFNKMVIFFGFNQQNSNTYYFDDLMVYGAGGGGGTCVPETTESGAAADLNITFQTDSPTFIEDNAGLSYEDNPDFDNEVNSSCRVGLVSRGGASGFDNIQLDLADKLDFNSVEGLKMKVWSPDANTPVLLKIEEIGNAGNFVQIEQTVTNANEWTELTFDFDATATPQFNKMVIFFGFNQQNSNTYYMDDLMVYGTPGGGGGGGGTCPAPPAGDFIADGDFEANADCWALFDVNTTNGGLTSISTTVSNGGGTNSGQIQTEAFGNPGIKQERFGAGTIQPNTTYMVTFDIKADAADPLADGAVLNVLAFSEPADGSGLPAGLHALLQGDASVATTWATRSYTFTTDANVDGGVSLLFELVCGGAATCGGTINIDNVSMTAQ